jgi:hypothetical protein
VNSRNDNSAKKSLFLLAGAPCSGKTTLLHALCTRGEKIFSDYFDFQSNHLKHPPLGENTAFDVLVRDNYWLPGQYLKDILALEVKPKTVVMHVDILGMILFERSPLSYWEALCRNESVIVKKYERIFQPLFDQYDNVCINTLDVKLSELCKRYQIRRQEKVLIGTVWYIEIDRKNLVRMEQKSKGWIYRTILNSWMSIFKSSHKIIRLKTTWSGNKLNIQKLAQAPAGEP